MSLVYGVFRTDGKPVDPEHLVKMNERLPGHFTARYTILDDRSLGMGRTPDESEVTCSDADLVLQDGNITLTGDVRLYNRSELLDLLPGTDRNCTDLRLVFEAYKCWGSSCTEHFNGDFVFAVHDKKRQTLCIFRDHLGIRPLYYAACGNVFAFAGDPRALLTLPFVSKKLDRIILYSILTNTYHIDTAATVFESIRRLPAAHFLVSDCRKLSIRKYWSPGKRHIRFRSEEDYVRTMDSLVREAVRIRTEGLAITASELSGGLDSAVVTILAARLFRNFDVSIPVFSWSPDHDTIEHLEADERDLIASVCDQEGLTCHFFHPDESWGKEPFLPPYQAGEWVYLQYKKMCDMGIHTVLSGWGGDQAVSYRHNMNSLLMNRCFRSFWREARLRSKGSVKALLRVVYRYSIKSFFDPYGYLGAPNKGMPEFIDEDFRKKYRRRCKKDIVHVADDPVRHIESGDIQSRTEWTAWLGAYYGIRVLYPLLDRYVVDFALSIPRDLFYKNGQNRYLFRKTFQTILPPKVRDLVSKDDPARSAYIKRTLIERTASMRQVAENMRRELFNDAVDWERFEKVLADDGIQTDLRLHANVFYKLKALWDIQQILDESVS